MHLELLGLGDVGVLGLILAHSLASVPRLPLGLALQVGHTGLLCKRDNSKNIVNNTFLYRVSKQWNSQIALANLGNKPMPRLQYPSPDKKTLWTCHITSQSSLNLPMLTSPTVACLYREYRARKSSIEGATFRFLTCSAAASNCYNEENTRISTPKITKSTCWSHVPPAWTWCRIRYCCDGVQGITDHLKEHSSPGKLGNRAKLPNCPITADNICDFCHWTNPGTGYNVPPMCR